MKATCAVLIAAMLGASAPALACPSFLCLSEAVGDDLAPPYRTPLPPAVEAQVRFRDGRGLSQAGFYNDPSVYMGYAHSRVMETQYGGRVRARY